MQEDEESNERIHGSICIGLAISWAHLVDAGEPVSARLSLDLDHSDAGRASSSYLSTGVRPYVEEKV